MYVHTCVYRGKYPWVFVYSIGVYLLILQKKLHMKIIEN